MALVTTVAATDTPVSLAEAKEQCRIVSADTTHDSLLTRLIDEATQSIETLTGARLTSQTVRLELDGFSGWDVDLGVYPVNSITSFVYDDADNDETAMVLGTDYWESLGGMYPKVCPVEYWPTTKYRKPASVRIVMDVGYSTGSPHSSTAPDDLRHAVLMRVKEYFDHSGESVTGVSLEPTVSSVEHLIAMHRRLPV